MIMEIIQALIQMFSMPLLYAIVAWFAIIGFVVRAAMVIFLTRMSPYEIVPVSLRLHMMSLAVAYAVAPVCTVIMLGLQKVLWGQAEFLAVNASLYVWYSVIMIAAFRCLLCRTFVSVACRKWQIGLLCVDGFVMIMGDIFLRSMHLV